MCKGSHGGPRDTTTIAHQVAHDKPTCYKRQTLKQHPVMKVDEYNVTCSNCMIMMYN
jgi:hypothetical protein